MESEITEMKKQIDAMNELILKQADSILFLQDIVLKGQFSNKKVFSDRIEMTRNVFIKDVDDISLTTIGDTSSSNQAANITENFNKFIGALTNK